MNFETHLNLFLTLVNVVSVWSIAYILNRHTDAMKVHREYLEETK